MNTKCFINTNIYRHNNITAKVVSFKINMFFNLHLPNGVTAERISYAILLKREFKPSEKQML